MPPTLYDHVLELVEKHRDMRVIHWFLARVGLEVDLGFVGLDGAVCAPGWYQGLFLSAALGDTRLRAHRTFMSRVRVHNDTAVAERL